MEKIGKYDIVRQIGEGGFGVVYEGVDPFLKRRVAIKTCTSEAKELRERFFREAEIAGKLQHRHIVTVHDFGIHEEIPYLVQEFLSGHDLDQLIARRKFIPPLRKIDILLDVARGLEHAHHKGVIHRDIKPGNIRILDDGSAKILDFGIAKLANVASHLTRTGMTVGTAAYLPPEQIRGAEVDHRADIFSFGVTAHEFLIGQRPYEGKTISKLFYQILNEPPPSLKEEWPDCPPQLASIVERALEKDPDQRYPAFSPLIRELSKVQAEMQRQREQFGEGATDVIPDVKQGLTSLGQALVDEEDVVSGHHVTEIEGPPPAAASSETRDTAAVDPGERVVAWAQQLLDEGDPSAAQEALRLFLAESPKHSEASELLGRIEREMAAQRLESLRGPIEAHLAAGEFESARTSLAEAEREGFTPGQLADLQRRVDEAEQEAKRVAEARQAEIAEKAAEPQRLIAAGQFARAQRLTESLLRHYGEQPALVSLQAELEKGRAEAGRRLVEASRQALSESDISAAEGALAKLRKLAPEAPEVEELTSAIETQRAVERRVSDILKRVEGLVAAGHLDAAFAALKAAETQHGAAPFVSLQRRIRKLRRQKLDQEVAECIEEARKNLKAGELGQTVAAVERALAIDPNHEEALAVLQRAQAQLRQVEPETAEEEADASDARPTDGGATVKLSPEQVRAAEELARQEHAAAAAASSTPSAEIPTAKISPPQSTRTAPSQPAPNQSASPAPPAPRPAPSARPRPTASPAVPASSQSASRPAPETARPAASVAQAPVEPPSRRPEPQRLPKWALPAGIAGLVGLLLVVLTVSALFRREAPEPATTAEVSEPAPVAESTPMAAPPASEPAPEPIEEPAATSETTPVSESAAADPDPEPALETEIASAADESGNPPGEAAEPEPAEGEAVSSLENDEVAAAEPPPTNDATPDPITKSPPTLAAQDLLLVGDPGVEAASLTQPLVVEVEPNDGAAFSLLYVLVAPDGTAERVVVLPGGTSDPDARNAAAALARSALYVPASRDGAVGRQWTVVRVDY